MKKKIFATVLCMVTAVSMLTGCGGTSSDTSKDNEPVMESEAVQTTDEATDNTTVSDTEAESESEDTTTEVSDTASDDLKNFKYHYAISENRDVDGNELFNVAPLFRIVNILHGDCDYNGVPANWNEALEYVDVDGEQWVQVTYTFDDAVGRSVGPYSIPEHENPFVFAVSPDTTKVLYKGVVYIKPEQ